jgi:RPA family protein
MAEPQKRQIAYKVRIGEILSGHYVKEEGWQPNYILTVDGRKISRINLIAAVINIQKEDSTSSVVVDDGTGEIVLRSFEGFIDIKEIGVGDIVNIIGKPREFGQEKYILPEIMKRLQNPGWIGVRNLEVSGVPQDTGESIREARAQMQEIQPGRAVVEEAVDAGKSIKPEKVTPFQRIYSLIKELDSGEGAEISEVARRSGLDNAEEILAELLKEGEIFEIRRGKVKVLE